MEFYQNLKSICDSKSTSVTALLKKLQLSGAYGTNWKKKGMSPTLDVLVMLSEELNVSLDYLAYGKEASLTPEEQQFVLDFSSLNSDNQIRVLERIKTLLEIQDEEYKKRQKQIMVNIDIADVAAGAGISTPFSFDDVFTPHEFPQNVIPDNVDCGVPINGDSMEPQYPNGCIAWVKRTDTINYGDVIIAILNGEPYCKIYQPDGLYSYNKNYETLKVHEQDSFSIFGKVIGYFVE